MGLFDKNPNEAYYAGGKKHFTDVIKNTSPGNTLIWLNLEEDFNTNSTLIVAESEEALFFKDGIIEQVFTGGKYKLDTNNYPFISRLRNMMSGGISTFNCKVYFVNKVHSMEILWGTDSPIQVRDPVLCIATSVMARGAYRIQVQDSKKFLLKMVGNSNPYMREDELVLYFRNQFSQHIKSAIAKYIKSSNEEILGICSEQERLAGEISGTIEEIFEEYGLRLINFSIAALDIPENDPNRAKLEDAYAQRGQQQILGISWAQQESSEILHEVARNQGMGGGMAAGAGLGMGMAAGSVFGTMAQQMFTPLQNGMQQPPMQGNPQITAPGAGAQPSGRFTQTTQPGPGNPGQIPAAGDSAGAGAGQPTAGSVKCPGCGMENSAGSKFCNNCGTKLVQERPKCPNCGTENAPGSKFCNNCGSPLGAAPAPRPTFCSSCGAKLEPGTRFCNECGAPQA